MDIFFPRWNEVQKTNHYEKVKEYYKSDDYLNFKIFHNHFSAKNSPLSIF
ncbi:hypothetical protein LEP1GSC194_3213 [Leptospira alstonii serovar Sichuan str. 79601]|uniref:Uncharacterized protein n=1 Tax=Leptospira alstonii serovar Sichuan str. 79601 TaxID=1218565 RepID=M6D8I9_9LEPT|nr:hypothetical protein LEP1GSC194_3213 [Leptospira alstonii serovar Sichuan str. 79601]